MVDSSAATAQKGSYIQADHVEQRPDDRLRPLSSLLSVCLECVSTHSGDSSEPNKTVTKEKQQQPGQLPRHPAQVTSSANKTADN